MAIDTTAVCELLRAVQSPDSGIRKAGEKRLDEALDGSPDELVLGLCQVLYAKDEAVAPEALRQEAAVLLRQSVAGAGARIPVWPDLAPGTQIGLKAQLLATVESDSSNAVRRSAGTVVAAIAELVGEDFEELVDDWRELMPALSRFVGVDCQPATRVAALRVLKELASVIGSSFISKGGQVVSMLQNCLTCDAPDVRAAGAQLVLKLVEEVDQDVANHLTQLAPVVVTVIQSFGATAAHEDLLKDILESLIAAVDEEPEFFVRASALQQLWTTLIQLCGRTDFADEAIRHSAMEAATGLAAGLAGDFCKPDGQPLLEQIIGLNVEWMLDVEEDVDAWTALADADDCDELDGATVEIGEENLDRLADKCAEAKQLEEVFLPMLFKVVRMIVTTPTSTWKHLRAGIMAVSQVVEHIEEESWIDQCVELVSQQLGHAHPRVRDAAFRAVGQVAFDHEPYVQESYHELLLPAIVAGIDDANIRVASSACGSFVSFGEELNREDIMPHLDTLLTKMFSRLQKAETRTMQEQCLSGMAVVSEVAEELFAPYYGHIMPVLKGIVERATGEKERLLRGKAFECISLVGDAVGRDVFLVDAHEVMQAMMATAQAGLSADDQTREYIHEASGRIAGTLEKDFKPYVPLLLPGIFSVLARRAEEVDPAMLPDDDDDRDDMSFELVGEKVMGLKTTVLKEMEDALSLIITLVQALEEDFCEFLATTCQHLLPLLNFGLSESVREQAFKSWEVMANCARDAADKGRIDRSVVRELVGEFLKATLTAMTKLPESGELEAAALGALQSQAIGVSGVVRKAGRGVLEQADVRQLVGVIVQLLNRVASGKSEPIAEVGKRRTRKKGKDDGEDDDGENEDGTATRQSVRFCLADIAGSLMRSCRQDFAEVGLPVLMAMARELLQPERSAGDRSLALYILDDAVECLGELSVPHWDSFMELTLACVSDQHSVVRQYAASTLGNAAQVPVFSKMAPSVAQRLVATIQKHGERHRKRRAVNTETKQIALAVDAAIKALGLVCEHQEQQLGADSAVAWSLWLTSLPLRYDEDEGQKAHAQLLELVVANHTVVTSPEQLPQVLRIFADIYKSRFSNAVLDREVVFAISRAPDMSRRIAGELPDKQRKKVEQMLRDGSGKSQGSSAS